MSKWAKFLDFIRYRRAAAKQMQQGKPLDEQRLELGLSGFVVHRKSFRPYLAMSHSVEHVSWATVSKVTAYKQDNFTWDTIWLELEVNGDPHVRISEETEGWKDLLTAIPANLPGALAPETWWDTVVHPAFAENATVIYPPPPNNSSKPTPLRGAA